MDVQQTHVRTSERDVRFPNAIIIHVHIAAIIPSVPVT